MDFGELARLPDERMELLLGALLIARDAHPELDVAREIARIDALAEPLVGRGLGRRTASEQALELAHRIYVLEGFRGNVDDYYDPRNSFINVVLDRRLGIPISLAVVYVEVARRADVIARGVSFPGHFLVRIDDRSGGSVLVDPFGHGAVVGPRELAELGRRFHEGRRPDPASLAVASPRQVLFRMLGNLRTIHATRGDLRALLVVLDRMLDLMPEAHGELRDRGLLSARLGAPRAAIDDLSRYVRTAPNAGDVPEVRRIIDQLERSLSAAPN